MLLVHHLLRLWYLLPVPAFVFCWVSIIKVAAHGNRSPLDANDFYSFLTLGASLALICGLIPLARYLRASQEASWRYVGYMLTTLAFPLWLGATALAYLLTTLKGHPLRIGC
ncbi:hypothetical protein C7S18_18370 [Ahniella affigens]|uniref:Uncharacterized protein n=1 Tax=Ahniella affigens TaxID=2021234 RepID=A0A2P1PW11_9GAMM|nr:hypothetical protein [Ahniella affigens]AVP99020.1 hypothetical protein C7S18_18370 [Ahniella affigens]